MYELSPLHRRVQEAGSSRFAVQPKRPSYLAAIEQRAGAHLTIQLLHQSIHVLVCSRISRG